MLDRAGILRLIPHQGRMCLLDRVLAWDAASITCTASSHRAPDNPLRRNGRLAGVCAVEYGLQAMALHGALAGGGLRQPPGMVTTLRDVLVGVAWVDDVPADLLTVRAARLAGEPRGCLYAFEVAADGGGRVLSSGRATILIPEPGA